MDITAAFDEVLRDFFPPRIRFGSARMRAGEKSRALTAAQWLDRNDGCAAAAATLYSNAAHHELLLSRDEDDEIPAENRLRSLLECLVRSGQRQRARELVSEHADILIDVKNSHLLDDDVQAQLRMADALKRKDPAAALECLHHWSRGVPIAMCLWTCARALDASGDRTGALRFLHLVAIADPSRVNYHLLSTWSGDLASAAALQYAEQIAAAFPTAVVAQALLIQQTLRVKGEIAIVAIEPVTQRLLPRPMLPKIDRIHAVFSYAIVASAWLRNGRAARAVDILTSGCENYPNEPMLNTFLGIALLHAEEPVRAIDVLETTTYHEKNDSFWPGTLVGSLLLHDNQALPRASRALEEAIRSEPQQAALGIARNALGVVRYLQSRFTDAVHLFAMANDSLRDLPQAAIVAKNLASAQAAQAGAVPIAPPEAVSLHELLQLAGQDIVNRIESEGIRLAG